MSYVLPTKPGPTVLVKGFCELDEASHWISGTNEPGPVALGWGISPAQ